MLEPAPLPPLNFAAAERAERHVGEVIAAAKRGHEASKRLLIAMAAAPGLQQTLNRLAAAAEKCAPTLDEIKISACFSADAKELRFAADAAADALSHAAGRAVVVTLPRQIDEAEAAELEVGRS